MNYLCCLCKQALECLSRGYLTLVYDLLLRLPEYFLHICSLPLEVDAARYQVAFFVPDFVKVFHNDWGSVKKGKLDGL